VITTPEKSDVKKIKVLFVCLGNICRSPTAEAVFRKLVDDEGLTEYFEIDSAGTAGYHIDDRADKRSVDFGKLRGYDLTPHRGRIFVEEDFAYYDYVLPMDKNNYSDLAAQCTTGWSKLKMFIDFAPETGYKEVPDPYYKIGDAFELVLDLCESAAKGLLKHIKAKHLAHLDAAAS
jgi:protein-tyrosine phosphatase